MYDSKARDRGFTLLELMTVIVIIAILAVMLFPILNLVKARVAKIKCMGNLRNLHVAANSYMMQYNHWPQISTSLVRKQPELYAKGWIDSLEPFGTTRKAWICPTTQELMGSPDYTKDKNTRTDYLATPFDSKPRTPFQWVSQPWFAEHSDVHGGGNLLIMPDGSVHQLSEYAKKQ